MYFNLNSDLNHLINKLHNKKCFYDICTAFIGEKIKGAKLHDYGSYIDVNVIINLIEKHGKKYYWSLSEIIEEYFYLEEKELQDSVNINIPIGNNRIILNGNSTEVFEIPDNYYIFCSKDELIASLFDRDLTIKALLAAKILTYSFYLSEFLDIFSIEIQYTIYGNKFFNSFNDLLLFLREINVIFDHKYFDTFKENLLYYTEINNIILSSKIDLKNLRLHIPNFFAENIVLYQKKEQINCNYWFLWPLNIPTNMEKQKRKVDIWLSEPGENSYEYYMQRVCNLEKKSLDTVMLRNIYNYLLDKEEIKTSLVSNYIIEYLNMLKTEIQVVNNSLLYNNYHFIPYLYESNLENIKTKMRKHNILQFYVVNLMKRKIDLIYTRKKKDVMYIKLEY